jgi:hypothetical protein
MKPPVLLGNQKLFLSLAQFVYISTITIPINLGGTSRWRVNLVENPNGNRVRAIAVAENAGE